MSEHTIPLQSAVWYYSANWLLRLLKFKNKERHTYYFKWGSFDTRMFGLGCELTQFSTDADYANCWSLSLLFLWGRIWLDLPTWVKSWAFGERGQDCFRSWGFSWRWFDIDQPSAYLALRWGHHSKHLEPPWSYTHVRTEYLTTEGDWIKQPTGRDDAATRLAYEAAVAKETYPYRYALHSGEVQHCLATISVGEWEWRPRMTKRWPLFRKIRRSVDVQFSAEVGERRGSWKGGCIACSTELRFDETPHEALLRMQRTRKFD